MAPLALYTVICIHCPPKKIIAHWRRLLNYCLIYIVPTCAQISFASFNGVEQFFYWLQKQVENYALHIDTTTNESLQ